MFRSASYRNMQESYCLYAKLENLQSMENCEQAEYISDNVGSLLGVLCILQGKQLFSVMGKVLCIPFCKLQACCFYGCSSLQFLTSERSDKRLLFQRLYLHVDGETW